VDLSLGDGWATVKRAGATDLARDLASELGFIYVQSPRTMTKS
jgi:hypothetical protein